MPDATGLATVNPLPNLAPTWNMAPTMDAPVVRFVDGERHLDAEGGPGSLLQQGLKKARKPINACAETIAKSGMFRAAFAECRCLVPAPPTTNGATIPTARRLLPWRASTASRSFSGRLGKVAVARRRDPADLRDHHHGSQPAAC